MGPRRLSRQSCERSALFANVGLNVQLIHKSVRLLVIHSEFSPRNVFFIRPA